MIATVSGKVLHHEPNSLVVEVGGVGLQVFVPASTRDHLQPGEQAFLFTVLVLRQDSISLYGFESQEAKDFFNLLLTVNGVGPRMALGILSVLNPDTIRRAVLQEQPEVFNRVPGVGRKTAQKILLTLQDKITAVDGLEAAAALSDVDGEVLAALTSLGFSVVEAQAAIQSIGRSGPSDLEGRLRKALQYFSD
jgi:holliday junction DNA helicase RuvA